MADQLTPTELMYGIHSKEKGKPYAQDFIKDKLSSEFEISNITTHPQTGYINSFFLKPKKKEYGPFNKEPLRVYWMGLFTDKPQDPGSDFRIFNVYFEPDWNDPDRNSYRIKYIARVAQLLGFLIDANQTNTPHLFLDNLTPEKFLSLSQGGKLTLKENFLNTLWWYFEGYFLNPLLGGKTSFMGDLKITIIFIATLIITLKFNIGILAILLILFALVLLYFSRRGTLTLIGYCLIGWLYLELLTNRYSASFGKIADYTKSGLGFLLFYALVHSVFYGIRWLSLRKGNSLERPDVSSIVKEDLRKFKVFTLKGIINWGVMGFLLQYAPFIIKMLP